MKRKLLHFAKLSAMLLTGIMLIFKGNTQAQSINNTSFTGAGTLSTSTGTFDVGFNSNNYAAMGFLSTPKAAIFGNLDYSDILFSIYNGTSTNNEYMRITKTGNVGIGTSSPGVFAGTDKLLVNSVSAGDTQIRLGSAGNGVYSSSLMYNNSSGEFRISQNDGGSGMTFYTSIPSTEKMRIQTNGNIGIGTTSPTKLLELYGSEINTTPFTNSISGIKINNDYGGALYSGADLIFGGHNGDRIAGIEGMTTGYNSGLNKFGGSLLFGTNPATGGESVERMRITDAGNVGIGTTSPNLKLDVNGVTGYPIALGSGAQTKGVARFGTAQDIYLDFGTADAAPWGFWMQAHTIANDISFPILLNPLGGNVGIGTTSPAQKLDVAGTVQMTGIKLTTGATNGYALISDVNGVGTWQPAGSGTISGSCSSGTNYVPKMSGTSAITCSQIYDNGTNVGIGTSSPAAKLNIVSNSTNTNGIDVEHTVTSGTNYGVLSNVSGSAYWTALMGGTNSSTVTGDTYGAAYTLTGSGIYNIAIRADNAATATTGNYGGWFVVTGAAPTNTGLYAYASGATSNIGLYIGVSAGASNYSIYSSATVKSYFAGNVGIGTSAPSVKLEVTGDVAINGNCTRTGTDNFTSDRQFKTNIDSLYDALSTIKQLKPRSFYFDTANVYGLNFSNKKQYGFIAQDVEPMLPELVSSTSKNADVDSLGNIIHPAITYKALNYNAFFGILTKGIQELQEKNDSLKTKTSKQDSINVSLSDSINKLIIKTNTQDSINNSLQNRLNQLASIINDCCNKGNGQNNNHSMQSNNNEQNNPESNINIQLANNTLLYQNVPNPFGESTMIRYFIPDNINKAAFIVFYDSYGKEIKKVEIKEKGYGNITVDAQSLSNGIYSYSLIIDGIIKDTKKMIKQ